ncbi:MAG: SDR family NAD(P)-dependent oxidoreductase [Alistipes sp.]|nr:SDR family NAD(P)-dependent oxidoreductase [Alistipes sp.]
MKSAIIIGATSGIGRAVAVRLVEEGWRVAIAGRRVQALEEFCEQYGSDRVVVAQMDVTRDDAVVALDDMISRLGAPDLLLYASGAGSQNVDLDPEVELRAVRTNSEGMVRIVSHFMRYVRSSKAYNRKHRAHIAVITSVAGTAGIGVAPAYSATKSMQSVYITALAQLARMQRIPVIFTDIRPGFVKTAILNPAKHYPMLMSAEVAAEHIVRGLKRRRRILIFDWRYRALVALWRLIPRCIWERLRIVKN